MKWEEKLKTALGNLKFESNELAYLALTSKPEHVIRDRLAFRLHETHFPHSIVVREYERIDLAILSKGREGYEPEVLLQLKTWSLFTFIKNSDKQFQAIQDDEKKCRDVSKTAETYCLLLSTCPSSEISSYKTIVKYCSGWQRALEEHNTIEEIETQAHARIKEHLSPYWQIVHSDKISAGEAFETRVMVHYWLITKSSTHRSATIDPGL